MSPYEIVAPGGSVEHFNEEAGSVWMERVVATYPSCVWLNPVPEREWDDDGIDPMMRQILGGRMYPLTLEGLDAAMRELGRLELDATHQLRRARLHRGVVNNRKDVIQWLYIGVSPTIAGW